MKPEITTQLKKLIQKKYPQYKGEVSLEYPPDSKMGDLGFPCFELAKLAKKSPHDIAKELAQEFPKNSAVSAVQAIGPYLNFFLNKESLWKEIFRPSSLMTNDSFLKIMVEFSSPNTNKPLHLGHVRNNVLGDSVSRLLKSQGHKVIKASQTYLKGILDVTNEPLVSSDFIGNPYSAIIDLDMTRVVAGDLVKVIAWYDNEWAYACRMIEVANEI